MQGDNTVAIALGTRLPYLLHPFCDQRLLKKTALVFLVHVLATGTCSLSLLMWVLSLSSSPSPSPSSMHSSVEMYIKERNTSSMFSSTRDMFGSCCFCVCVCESEWNSPSFSSSIPLSPSGVTRSVKQPERSKF
ncbi:hypothetical protein Ahy_A06g027643 isoform F [Arachis hypogaea]|uniref:Uncharacterized protein n=1 Tax=Arachis hypogaea TaxID=3818 RepID=A0A445CPA0_ARAHY|nr:hypothetical protein Ahy_A06g027643 isoform F [Arachis hypogaea]